MLLIGDALHLKQLYQSLWIDNKISPMHKQCVGVQQNKKLKAFKANIIVNIHQLTKIITTALWEINRDEDNTIA